MLTSFIIRNVVRQGVTMRNVSSAAPANVCNSQLPSFDSFNSHKKKKDDQLVKKKLTPITTKPKDVAFENLQDFNLVLEKDLTTLSTILKTKEHYYSDEFVYDGLNLVSEIRVLNRNFKPSFEKEFDKPFSVGIFGGIGLAMFSVGNTIDYYNIMHPILTVGSSISALMSFLLLISSNDKILHSPEYYANQYNHLVKKFKENESTNGNELYLRSKIVEHEKFITRKTSED
jgi:hypothetical protein